MKALPGRSLHPAASRAGPGNHAPQQALRSSASERSGSEHASPAALSRFQPGNQEACQVENVHETSLPPRLDLRPGASSRALMSMAAPQSADMQSFKLSIDESRSSIGRFQIELPASFPVSRGAWHSCICTLQS